MTFIIREYLDSDKEKLIEMLLDFQEYLTQIDSKKIVKPYDTVSDCEIYLQQLIKDVAEKEGKFYIAEFDGELAGFTQGIIERHQDDKLYTLTHEPGDHGWIGELYTRPEFRNRGIGKTLVSKMAEYFKKAGCINMRLMVMADNELALNSYKKIGFISRDIEMSKDL